jgi:hypothetical protein
MQHEWVNLLILVTSFKLHIYPKNNEKTPFLYFNIPLKGQILHSAFRRHQQAVFDFNPARSYNPHFGSLRR